MRVQHLTYMRVTAIVLSGAVATLTLCNLLTVVTHGIDFDIPDEGDFTWAIDPSGAALIVMTEFTVSNHGAYDIDDIDIGARLRDEHGSTLLEFEERDMDVPQGSERTFELLIPITLEDIRLADWFPLLYRNMFLDISIDIDVDYMFGLVHLTVDETLRYPWVAPFANMEINMGFFDGIKTLLDISGLDYDIDILEAQRSVIEFVTSVDGFDFGTEEGFQFRFDNNEATQGLSLLGCEISIPVGEGGVTAAFSVMAGIINERPTAILQEVTISYVRQ